MRRSTEPIPAFVRGIVAVGVALAVGDGRSETGAAPRNDVQQEKLTDRVAPIEIGAPVPPKDGAEWVFLPIPDSNPTIGTGLRLLAAHFFKADPNSQPSVLGAGGAYYSSDTKMVGAGGLLNLFENQWRISGGVGYADVRYNFYGVGRAAGDQGIALPIQQTGAVAMLKALRRVSESIYVGAGYRYIDSRVGLDIDAQRTPEIDNALHTGVRLTSSGPTLAAVYDTRDLNTNPRSGSYVEAELIFPSAAFGSDSTYHRLNIKASHYITLAEKYTLAGRLSLCDASEQTPFFDLCLFGSGNDLRGYAVGRYQDRSMFAAQAELRTQFSSRWGGVLFAGLGEVAPRFADMTVDRVLPSVGFGVRFVAAPENKVNISADLAWGKAGATAFYLYVGEAL